jgi:carbamoyl-phosphate synthase large subunit
MGKSIRVLVLGVGGNVSQGILKAIAASSIKCRVIGACVSSESIGLYFCDIAYIAPFANSEEFIPWLIDICNKESVDIVFTGVEENIFAIAANMDKFKKGTNAIFKCTSYEYLKIGQDKLDTCTWLEENGCNYPRYSKSEDAQKAVKLVEEVGYPLIAKPRKGKGSKGIVKICNENDFKQVLKMKDYVIQELIGTEDREYTVGCYCDKSGRLVDSIIMKRELRYGTTFKAEIVDNEAIRAEVTRICEKFKPTGPLNVQLRLDHNNRPVCFELNIRFSGTTPMRAHYGFNDVEAMIKEYVLQQDISHQFKVRKGVSYRYMNEIYFENDVQQIMQQDGVIHDVKNYGVSVDTLGGKL